MSEKDSHRQYTHAVVMGDLVGSEKVSSPTRLHSLFNAGIESSNQTYRDLIVSPLTITLGDEFQGLCTSLQAGLGIVRFVRERLLSNGVDCRFALGVVKLETKLNPDHAWNMMGLGLSTTRERLSDKRNVNLYRFYLPDEDVVQRLVEAVALSISVTEAAWTDRQREIVLASIPAEQGNTGLAQQLGISVRTLYKIQNAARLEFYKAQWSVIESTMAHLDRGYGLDG